MSGPLLPSLQAADLRRALTDYLSTTFALTDDDVRAALTDFLTDPDAGIFRGPYARLRLPFRPADGAWTVALDWWQQDFTPYVHQAQAFERLSSKHAKPRPTLVTTGTGSGKTEAFLIPILDHALRMRQQGQRGLKALLLYPMNALANDQAGRLAKLLTGDERLKSLTAGLYTGDDKPQRTQVTSAGLITSREVLRSDPPDLLLTNYKMLDQLLLRANDRGLWAGAEESLTYLVLDEFHTYDGAQGTDVAMLLRRLGSMLGVARDGAPLGDVVPVATSATLGGGDEASFAAMRTFAETVFGCPFDAEAVVVEDRMSPAEWQAATAGTAPGIAARPVASAALLAAAVRAATTGGPDAVAHALLAELFVRESDGESLSAADIRRLRGRGRLPALLAAHPLVERLLPAALRPAPPRVLAAAVLPDDASPGRADGVLVVEALLGLLSAARADAARGDAAGDAGRRLLGVDAQLWIREVTRVDRRVGAVPAFRWSDDGAHADAELFLPALYCRHCGRSGWGALRSVLGRSVEVSDASIRKASRAGDQRFRAFLHAPGEAASLADDDAAPVEGLLWLDVASLQLLGTPPAEGGADESVSVPVLVDWDDDAAARDQTCPSCQQPDGIRFLGTGVSTLTSVSLSALFGSTHLDRAEKKSLLFTDSVQDAAYMAGFVQARSHALSLRAALFETIDAQGPLALADLPREAMNRAGDDPVRRYRLVPPAVADWAAFHRYWHPAGNARDRAGARRAVERRLLFDAALEFGLNARTGRTLELTGAVVAEVDTDSTRALRNVGRRAITKAREQQSLAQDIDDALGATLDDARLAGWVRGVLERVRTQGGIAHHWLDRYVDDDGNRWFLTGGRGGARNEGLPAFPPGRPAPAFPTTAARADRLAAVTSTRAWYARWSARQLRLTNRDGGLVARALLEEAAAVGWLRTRRTNSGATVFALDPERITLATTDDAGLANGSLALRCDVCQTVTPGRRQTIDDLDGAACLRQLCPGTLRRAPRGDDYYRALYSSGDMRRVVAHEHTSLLPDKVRLDVETAFREGTGPAVPNVLTATPTLELGIDIGDLSTVLLGSLPRSVASYLQRVGRAGRLTGNALILAYVPGQARNSALLDDPLALLDGEVRPPATYLDAIEILRRQYVAWLVDRRARAGVPDPANAAGVFPDVDAGPGTWLGELLDDATAHAADYVETFLALFGDLVRPDTADDLRGWAGAGLANGEAAGLGRLVRHAAVDYRREIDELGHRHAALSEQVPGLREAAARPTATDEDRLAARLAGAELKFLAKRRHDLGGQFWVAALEERGVLPNYTLLDDTVSLDVTLRWVDHETAEYREEARAYQRGSAIALTEWAPGSTFYAQGLAVRIDAVDVGRDLDALVQTWRLCSACGWSQASRSSEPSPPVPASCPRCGHTGLADTGQALPVLPLERVSAQVSRDNAAISDSRDERDRLAFTVVPAADVDPDQVTDAWQLRGYPFGAEYVRQIDIRWVNAGRAVEQGAPRVLAGVEVRAPLFTVCPGCGVVPAAQPGVRDLPGARHRAWCQYRAAIAVPWAELALGRTLRTQAVRVLLPPHVTYDHFGVPSLRAALLLGLREILGGNPDHLDLIEAHLPVDGQDRTALLLHDRVPGGTGYLADLARPSRVREILTAALDVVAACPCRGEGLLACPRCLLPFTRQVERTSRARAEQVLRELLGLPIAGVGASPDADDQAGRGWHPERLRSIADIPLPSLDSALELRFRRVLTEALRARGAAVQEIPQLVGTEVRFGVPGQVHRRWTLRPQVHAHGSRPDFELLCEDPAIPRVYIFADGRLWHASPAHNRLADDAAKRAVLRSAGNRVWAVTDDDVATFEALARGDHAHPAGASWYTEAVRGRLAALRQQRIPAGSMSDATATADAVTQLVDWIMDPRPDAWRTLAEGLPFALITARPVPIGDRADLAPIAAEVLGARPIAPAPRTAGSPQSTPSTTGPGLLGWSWRHGPLAVATAARATQPYDVGSLIVVDDRDDTLSTDEGAAAWRAWLALSNILGHAAGARPLALSQALAPAPKVPAPPIGAKGSAATPAALTPAWQALVDTAADDDERALLASLAGAGVPLPEQGYETDDGYPLDLAWPDRHVAVLITPDAPLAATLADAGWQVTGPDLDRLVDLLNAVER
ncbi:DEAD/DEAH box helicase [Pseudofrankia sp. EUN1h]|uniref:DEAD/DEAH box helicase n=1 Tax=Pseudofrankia sp. EUN1h TaxID=1834515 RepID=UPI0008DA5473|nr:DEAD/DEAH box helicase [Pseudofrankia sp. EUN1h]OHV34839.1 heavy metal resistance protein CzcA [Pseudofrankia sp. EUN1h]